ncbi:MAG TPA: hypothetical protein VGT41_02550 [Candidatus Babeliales bacterium]|nr:hypothetical protein [Candidatus Babeliales bacterium]
MIAQRFFAVIVFVGFCNSLYSMGEDNRYLPLIQRPYILVENRPSHFTTDAFMTTASSAFLNTDETVGITEIYGPYDQTAIGAALEVLGKDNPLKTFGDEFIKMANRLDLCWHAKGKIQTQGFIISLEQALSDWFSIGFCTFFMRANGYQEFFLKQEDTARLSEDVVFKLDQLRIDMNNTLGISDAHSSQVGFGDIDAFIRFRGLREYAYRFKKIEGGVRLGFLIPTGKHRDITKPISIPFGGNGHWGAYFQGDVELELKEDWKVGVLFRLSKRFARITDQRLTVAKESLAYGAVVAPVRIDPGVSVACTPWIALENVRDGLGLRLLYTLMFHSSDTWQDARINRSLPVSLVQATAKSRWGSGYVTLNAFYDFGKMKVCRGCEPIVSLAWDIPVPQFVARRSIKSHRISLGVELNY